MPTENTKHSDFHRDSKGCHEETSAGRTAQKTPIFCREAKEILLSASKISFPASDRPVLREENHTDGEGSWCCSHTEKRLWKPKLGECRAAPRGSAPLNSLWTSEHEGLFSDFWKEKCETQSQLSRSPSSCQSPSFVFWSICVKQKRLKRGDWWMRKYAELWNCQGWL